ncbi:MAG TPA: hypothetical protein EYM56_01595 [Candidatus Poseidoniales archaeon]|nr:hypothetical protein [Candidatus Poseidoniales archaeon]
MFVLYALALSNYIDSAEYFKNIVTIEIPLGITVAYFAILGATGILVGKQTKSLKQALYAPIVMFIQHFGYSLGLIYGFLRRA